MVFLREGGKDELSLLLEHGRSIDTATSSSVATGSNTPDLKGKGRAVPVQQSPPQAGASRFPPAAAAPAARTSKKSEPSDSLLHRLAGPSTGKAGLKRDPNEVRAVIYESSKGGNYFKNEERKDEILTNQIKLSLQKLDGDIARRGGDLSVEERKADKIIAELEKKRDLTQYIVVVDCDAFYASVEELDDTSLKGKAFGVGEGVLTTASYEARKFGCRSAMPGYIAKKLCPHLIFVKPDFTKYSQASRKVMDVLARYDPNFAPASLDEAYMNITAYVHKSGMTAEAAISQMRAEVKQETGLTVSAGCGANTMLAKIATDVNKPDGQCVISPDGAAAKLFMRNLSVRKIPGIGRVTERWLEALGVLTCYDIYRLRGKLLLAKGESGVTTMLKAYLGIAGNVVKKGEREDRRGVGHETTFSTIWRPHELDKKLREIADSLGEDLKRLDYSGRTLTLKLKLETYEVSTRARTLDNGVLFHTADQLYTHGKALLDTEVQARAAAFDDGRPIKGKGRDLRLRLMGLKVSGLRDDVAHKQKSKGALVEWAEKAASTSAPTSSKTAGPSKSVNHGLPIDLTLEEDSEAEEDGFEDIVMQAAPCPNCHKTIAFADGVYEKHIDTCKKHVLDSETIQISSQDNQETEVLPNAPGQGGPKKQKPRHASVDSAGTVKSKTGKPVKGRPAKTVDAFSQLMKQSKQSVGVKKKKK